MCGRVHSIDDDPFFKDIVDEVSKITGKTAIISKDSDGYSAEFILSACVRISINNNLGCSKPDVASIGFYYLSEDELSPVINLTSICIPKEKIVEKAKKMFALYNAIVDVGDGEGDLLDFIELPKPEKVEESN